jgi:hypothetical protein
MKTRGEHGKKKEKEILLDESAETITAGSGRSNRRLKIKLRALK